MIDRGCKSKLKGPTPFCRAQRIQNIDVSVNVQISEIAAAKKASGEDVIALSAGEPDFPTPDFVIAAAHDAARAGKTTYPPTAGTPELRSAVAAEASVAPENIVISTGAKQVIANAILATVNPGDEVIMPTPCWTSYADIVALAGGVPVMINCPMADGFKLKPAALDAAITPKTRWIILNSPCNPSGAVYAAEEFAALAGVLRRHAQVWVLSDEIYDHLSYVPFSSFVDAAPDLLDRTLVVNGVSKAWAMTGWRLGWGVGPEGLIKAMTVVQGQLTSGASSISQAAALGALRGDRTLLADRRQEFRRRRDFVVARLNEMPGVFCASPQGAFYVFPNIEKAFTRAEVYNDTEFCKWLLREVGVAIVPGVAFGMPGHARISFAYSERSLDDALSRIAHALQQ